MGQFKYSSLQFADVIYIEQFFIADERGGLTKTYSKDVFAENGIDVSPAEETVIISRKGTIRGLHFQKDLSQSKLISCIDGELWFVVVDMDKSSDKYGTWVAKTVKAHEALFVPGKYAIGSFAKEDSVFHLMYSTSFNASLSSGIRWDDEGLAIEWPLIGTPVISEKDRVLGSFREIDSSV